MLIEKGNFSPSTKKHAWRLEPQLDGKEALRSTSTTRKPLRWLSPAPVPQRRDWASRASKKSKTKHGPTDASRLLSCISCGQPNETSWMQLRAKTGFRAIHCRLCRFQQLCSRNKCQCGVIWHHCPSHRIDPAKHLFQKAPKRSKEEQERRKRAQDQARAEGSETRRSTKRRKAPPEVEEGSEAIRKRRGNQRRKILARSFRLKPMKSIAPLVRCDPARLERIRAKQKYNENAKRDSERPPCNSFVPDFFF